MIRWKYTNQFSVTKKALHCIYVTWLSSLILIISLARLSLNVRMSVWEQNATTQVVYLACYAAGAAVAMTASTHLAHVTVFTNLPFIMSLPGDVLIDLILEAMSDFPSVRSSVRPQKVFSAFDVIWCVGRPRPNVGTRVTSTRTKVKVKVTELLNLRKVHFYRSIFSAVFAQSLKLMVGRHSIGPGL